ncbi:MAG: 30S ribosomal protein S6 [Phycisphaerales bacterium]|nr:MAG: 30S ribosomal protein S6 [Phycisphaerales bacterium]
METIANRLYEGMFLVDSAKAAADWDGTMAAIRAVLERSDAEIVSMRKWGDKRLAYDIDHKSRGTYVLCYFRADGRRIRGIEKDVQLSEQIMRVLVLSTEGRAQEDIDKDLPQASDEVHETESEQQVTDQDAEDAAAELEDTSEPTEEDAAEEVAPVEQEVVDIEATQESADLPSDGPEDRQQ